MINVDHGEVRINGTIIELCADVATAHAALLDTMSGGDDTHKEIATMLIKSLFFDMARRTKEKGYNVYFTEKELADYEKVWGDSHD